MYTISFLSSTNVFYRENSVLNKEEWGKQKSRVLPYHCYDFPINNLVTYLLTKTLLPLTYGSIDTKSDPKQLKGFSQNLLLDSIVCSGIPSHPSPPLTVWLTLNLPPVLNRLTSMTFLSRIRPSFLTCLRPRRGVYIKMNQSGCLVLLILYCLSKVPVYTEKCTGILKIFNVLKSIIFN